MVYWVNLIVWNVEFLTNCRTGWWSTRRTEDAHVGVGAGDRGAIGLLLAGSGAHSSPLKLSKPVTHNTLPGASSAPPFYIMFNFLSSDETERFYLYCWKWGVVKIFHGSYQGCLLMAQMLYISITRWKLALRLFCPANIGVCECPLIAIESSEYKGRIKQARLWTKMIQCIGSGTKGTFWIHLSFKGRLTLPLSIYLKIYFGR